MHREMHMTTRYQPEGYTTVSPYLIVHGAAATIDFLQRVFDATELRRYPNAEGRVMHAEVRIGDSVVMVADAAPQWPALPAHVHVYVPDVDATYRRALQAGAEPVQEPVRKQDEDKRGGVKDAGGTTWWIATRVG
jgi:PhnB protein